MGDEIPAGTYRTAGPGDSALPCYWSRLKNTSGEFASIIANGIAQGPTTITVKPTDVAVELTGACTWTKK